MAGLNLVVGSTEVKYKQIEILSFGQTYNEIEFNLKSPAQLIKNPLKNQL